MSPDDQPIQPDDVTDEDGAAAVDPLAALLGGGGGEGGPGLDFGALLAQASEMQNQMMAAQQEAAETVVEGVAGGGVVKVQVTGGMEFQSVTIDPTVVDPGDVDMLQDLVLAALRSAVDQVNDIQRGSLGGLGDVGGLGDLFGG